METFRGTQFLPVTVFIPRNLVTSEFGVSTAIIPATTFILITIQRRALHDQLANQDVVTDFIEHRKDPGRIAEVELA